MLSSYLKEHTSVFHDALEAKFNSNKIFEKSYSIEDYKKLIQMNYQFLLDNENAIHENLPGIIKEKIQIQNRKKLPVIQLDAANLGIELNSNVPLKINSVYEALGMFYVIEGASLGGNVIKKQLQNNPEFKNVDFHYFGMYKENIGIYWKDFVQTINDEISAENYPQVLEGATKAYQELLSYNFN